MKIDPNRPIGTGAVRRDSQTTGSSGFADNLPVDQARDQAAGPVGPASSLSGLEALFALQEVPDATAGRKRALARGTKLLDRLEDLRVGLLLGHISRDKLAELAQLSRDSIEQTDDPALQEILQEIELRAAVELAKFQGESGL